MSLNSSSPLNALAAFALRFHAVLSVPVFVATTLALTPIHSQARVATDNQQTTSTTPLKKSKSRTPAKPLKKAAAKNSPAPKTPVKPQNSKRTAPGKTATPVRSRKKHSKDVALLTPQPQPLRDSYKPPVLRSAIAYMVDRNTGKTLYEKNTQAVVPIASITKLMMAMVVLDSKAPLDEMVTVTDDDRDTEKNTYSRLVVGATLSRADMLHIALMASENRAAAALSRYYPGGRPAFIAAMNHKARSLGMMQTVFENPAGLSRNNVSTAPDLVKMVTAAYQYPLIRKYSTDHNYQVNHGKGILEYRNTNMLTRDPNWQIGLQKTGFINESGICLVMESTIKGRPVVMVLLDSVGKYSDFADANHLRTMLIKGEREQAPPQRILQAKRSHL